MSYTTAVYLRLSDDDSDLDSIKTESNSISGQRIIIRNFINNHPDLKNSIIKEYCDDGYSGINFKRPGIIKLLDDVKSGTVNCIIVKDLSRFGRNFIEVGNYLEQIFPVFNIRFIAVNDNYDSNIKSGCMSNIEIAFRNLMNEEYSKDISAKIKATKEIQKKQGLYINGIAPYGYKVKDKQLVVDNYAAEIVRQIFKMAEMGISCMNIAKALNSENIPTRSAYMKMPDKKAFWKANNISNILHNEVYIGTLINNRWGSNFPNVFKRNSSEDWIIFENHHEAIISVETFENIKKRHRKIKNRKSSRNNYTEFKKKVYCKGCKQPLQKHYTKNIHNKNTNDISFFYRCDYGNTDNCCKDKVNISHLKKMTSISIKNYLNIISDKLNSLKIKHIENKKNTYKSILAIDDKIKQFENKILIEYTNYRTNTISKQEFISRRGKLSDKIYAMNLEKEKINSDSTLPENIITAENIVKKFNSDKSISDETIDMFVKKIFISSNEEIEIEFNFKDIFDTQI